MDYFQDPNYYQDNNLPYPLGFGIYIYKIEPYSNQPQYSLIMEYWIKNTNGVEIIIGDENEVIDEMLLSIEKINKQLMKMHPIAKVNVIKNDNLIVGIKEGSPIRSGTILKGAREYREGYDDISDEGVQKRIKDLQELHDCFQSNSAWKDSIDEQYDWSYDEYDDLVNKKYIKYKATEGSIDGLEISVKIEDVFDSTASAIIIERDLPECIKIKVGDLLYLK